MKQLIIPDKVQKEMLTDFMLMGKLADCSEDTVRMRFRFIMPMQKWHGCLATIQWKNWLKQLTEKLYRQMKENWLLSVLAMILHLSWNGIRNWKKATGL